jgi:integrase
VPRLRRIPTYRLHKPTGQAVVTIDGRDHYLGRHGTPASRALYDRLIAEWLARKPAAPCPTVDEILVRYLEFARAYYRKSGVETAEVANLQLSLRPLHNRFGALRVVEFGPRALKTVRQDLIASGVSRLEINRRVGRIRRMFRWAASEELIPAGIVEALSTVADLKRGRTTARENPPVTAVPESFVDAVRPFVSRQVWAMIELQRLTGMRPGEVTIMRTVDLDVTGRIWTYRPSTHKMEHADRSRTVHLGPRAQEILRPWLRPNLEEFLFQPREAEAERRAELRQRRKTPVPPSQRDRATPDPKKQPGDRYETRAYAHAIARACRKAGVPAWGPNRLRHLAATLLRREFGLDVAQVVLGHASPDTTLIYAEADRQRAAEAMLRMG